VVRQRIRKVVRGVAYLDGCLNVLVSALVTHLFGGEVGVQTSTVPVTRDGLGVERDLGAEVLSNAVEPESSESSSSQTVRRHPYR
jgi:hypothetical protein